MTPPSPRVGIGVFIIRNGQVLLGKRIGSHGEGTWALPGGHLEFGESVQDCAAREVEEETGLKLGSTIQGPYVSHVFEQEQKHYITLFVLAHQALGEPEVREPQKCEAWEWFRWSELPSPLFPPLETLRQSGFVPAEAA